ncbi:MAG: isopentenyl-diphosphate Delta-isomerase [Chitinophagaceae bacterium]|nr:isopentenyl-diphosphate Delta-isomerase [Chitinophagaceae bacterium]
MTEHEVILVNEKDEQTGTMPKMEAHRKGILHRAFSVFILNNKGEMLLQRRALNKYHSGGLWTNACCSHPLPGEDTSYSAQRRLKEELGFTAQLNEVFRFTYLAKFDNGLTEHEYDHVFIGYHEGSIQPDPEEVSDYCYKSISEIRSSLSSHPHKYTEWFKIAFPKVEEYLENVTVAA